MSNKEATARSAMKLALEALEQYTNVVASVNNPDAWVTVVDAGKPAREAITALREALAKPDFWEGYVPEPVKPAQPVPDAFEQLMREADKPTQVPEGIAKYVDALVKGTHEITSVTIRPKRTWQGLTQDEIADLAEHYYEDKVVQVEEAIEMAEAKLRERNT